MLYPVTNKKVAIFDHKEKNRKGKRYVRNLGSNKVKKVWGFTKYDSKIDFDCKSILKLESNAKLT